MVYIVIAVNIEYPDISSQVCIAFEDYSNEFPMYVHVATYI